MKHSMNSYFSELASFGIGLARFADLFETTFFTELVCDGMFPFSPCCLMEQSYLYFLVVVADGVFLLLLCCLSRKPNFLLEPFFSTSFFFRRATLNNSFDVWVTCVPLNDSFDDWATWTWHLSSTLVVRAPNSSFTCLVALISAFSMTIQHSSELAARVANSQHMCIRKLYRVMASNFVLGNAVIQKKFHDHARSI